MDRRDITSLLYLGNPPVALLEGVTVGSEVTLVVHGYIVELNHVCMFSLAGNYVIKDSRYQRKLVGYDQMGVAVSGLDVRIMATTDEHRKMWDNYLKAKESTE